MRQERELCYASIFSTFGGAVRVREGEELHKDDYQRGYAKGTNHPFLIITSYKALRTWTRKQAVLRTGVAINVPDTHKTWGHFARLGARRGRGGE